MRIQLIESRSIRRLQYNMDMASIPPSWIPMIREAGIAAESFYSGLGALRKANYAQTNLYGHAFFGITIGLERLAKLAILIHSRATPGGTYPTMFEFKQKYGHNLVKLFAEVDKIRTQYSTELRWELPDPHICTTAIEILAEFASSTRYYNLDVLIGANSAKSARDPIATWFQEIGGWVLQHKYSEERKRADGEFARYSAASLNIAMVMHMAENGTPITSVYDAALRGRQMEIIQREGVVICACLGRHISELIKVLVYAAQDAGAMDVPFIEEFFPILNNSESYFRRRKTFQI